MNAIVKKIFALVFFKFPNRRPVKSEDLELAFSVWERIYSQFSEEALQKATSKFVETQTKLYPDDDPFAIIAALAKPQCQETAGDLLELALEAASRFGWYQEVEGMAWLERKSPLVAAAVRRFGFLDFCRSENVEAAKIQLRKIFEEEKERANRTGEIFRSAVELEKGKLPILEKNLKLAELTQRIAGKMKTSA